jgi:hypothetical protein
MGKGFIQRLFRDRNPTKLPKTHQKNYFCESLKGERDLMNESIRPYTAQERTLQNL